MNWKWQVGIDPATAPADGALLAPYAACVARPILPTAFTRGASTLALSTFRRLPAPARRALVRAGTPSYTVGAVCAVDHEGAVLVLRQPHRSGWSLPGGLLDRGESPADGVVREVWEETGLRITVGVPVATQVNARVRRVDVVYRVVVTSRPQVSVGGEARSAQWLTPQEITDDSDGATREILTVLTRALAPGAQDGRLLRP